MVHTAQTGSGHGGHSSSGIIMSDLFCRSGSAGSIVNCSVRGTPENERDDQSVHRAWRRSIGLEISRASSLFSRFHDAAWARHFWHAFRFGPSVLLIAI